MTKRSASITGLKKRKRCYVSGVLTAPTYWRIKTKHEIAETGQPGHAGG
jgi:hypothetical protein